MNPVRAVERFIEAHIVERVVVESPEQIRARRNLPSVIQAEMAMNILSLGTRGLLTAEAITGDETIIEGVRKDVDSLRYAEQEALRPPKTALRWKFFRR